MFSDGEGSFGEAGLDGHHGVGIFGGLRFGFSGEDKHFVDVVDVLLTLLYGFGVGAEVVVALRQAQSASAVKGDDLVGIGEVLVGAEIEKGVDADGVQMREENRQLVGPAQVRQCGRVPA